MADRDTPGTAGAAGRSATDEARDAMHRAQREARDTMDRTGHDAAESDRSTMGAAKGRVRSLFDQQAGRAADQLAGMAHALHSAAGKLHEEHNDSAARYADRAAERMERMADVVRHADLDEAMHRLEGFARRQPEVFVGVAFAAGFLIARFAKSSAERRHANVRSGYAYGGATSYAGPRHYETPDVYRPDVGAAYPRAGTGHGYESAAPSSSATGASTAGSAAAARRGTADLGMSPGDRAGGGTAASKPAGSSPGGTATAGADIAGSARTTNAGATGPTPQPIRPAPGTGTKEPNR